MTKEALESMQEGSLTVIVDNSTSRDNVERFAKSQGCHVRIRELDAGYSVEVVKGHSDEGKAGTAAGESAEASSEPNVVVYVGSDVMGVGDRELGSILIKAFLKTLGETTPKPQKMIFINSGVKLTTEGSEVIDSIKKLEAMNVTVLSCGTCLDYYQIKDKLKVGLVSNMFDIANALLGADRVVRP